MFKIVKQFKFSASVKFVWNKYDHGYKIARYKATTQLHKTDLSIVINDVLLKPAIGVARNRRVRVEF